MEVTRTGGPPAEMYNTTNQTYGHAWQTGAAFTPSFTQSEAYKTLTNRRQVTQSQLPKDNQSIALVHNPAHPCGIQSMSNVPTNTRGEFTNTRRDLYTNQQGLWANSAFNTPGATLDNGPTGTYSNLQGAWGRVGPSTYEATHGQGPWVSQWGAMSFEPPTLMSLYDHPNVNPHNNMVPIENVPQNM